MYIYVLERRTNKSRRRRFDRSSYATPVLSFAILEVDKSRSSPLKWEEAMLRCPLKVFQTHNMSLSNMFRVSSLSNFRHVFNFVPTICFILSFRFFRSIELIVMLLLFFVVKNKLSSVCEIIKSNKTIFMVESRIIRSAVNSEALRAILVQRSSLKQIRIEDVEFYTHKLRQTCAETLKGNYSSFIARLSPFRH